jgi:co-chaperonin GroES (HSP10)
MILGITPSIKIPKPIGGRVIIRAITSTLTIEEKYKRAGLIGVAAQKERPRNSIGFILAISQDPLIVENFKVGQMVYFPPLMGTEISLLGQTFRSLDFNDILSTIEEEEAPEPYKTQVQSFLRGEQSDEELIT